LLAICHRAGVIGPTALPLATGIFHFETHEAEIAAARTVYMFTFVNMIDQLTAFRTGAGIRTSVHLSYLFCLTVP